MKKKTVVIILVAVALLIAGAVAQPYRIYPADIKDIDIWVSESWPQKYYVRVVAGGSNTCWRPWRYHVTRLGNTIFVEVLTLHHRGELCGFALTYEEKIIPLGICFIPDMKYAIVATDGMRNFMVETFVAGRSNLIKK